MFEKQRVLKAGIDSIDSNVLLASRRDRLDDVGDRSESCDISPDCDRSVNEHYPNPMSMQELDPEAVVGGQDLSSINPLITPRIELNDRSA